MKKLYDIMEKKKKLYESLSKCNSTIEEKKKMLKNLEETDNIENIKYFTPEKENSINSLKKNLIIK